jgi:hypothetical protein
MFQLLICNRICYCCWRVVVVWVCHFLCSLGLWIWFVSERRRRRRIGFVSGLILPCSMMIAECNGVGQSAVCCYRVMVARVIYSALHFDSHFVFHFRFFLVMSYCLFSSKDFFLAFSNQSETQKSQEWVIFLFCMFGRCHHYSNIQHHQWKKQKGKEPEVWTIKAKQEPDPLGV